MRIKNYLTYNHEALKTITLPNSQRPNRNEKTSGLYFIGMMAIDPEGNDYYLIKVGQSIDCQHRINQYFSYNPIIYNTNNFLSIESKFAKYERDIMEENCHAYISRFAYGVADGTFEWFYVNKENYFLLCEMFKDKTTFEMIATGEVG